MIKAMLIKRAFNWIILALTVAAVSGSVYFYSSVKSNISTLDAGLALIGDVLLQRGIGESIGTAVSNLNSLAMIQIATFLITVISLLFLLWFVFRLYAIAELNSYIDPLTGLYNRRAVMMGLRKEMERAERFSHPMSIAVLDIDYFKQYNDLHGHKEGDKALKGVAKAISNSLRNTDIVGRIGGEEFLLVFPETTRAKTLILCERIRSNIEKKKFEFEEEMPKHRLTVSIGVAEFNEKKEKTETDVFENADKQLYMAKLSGRNAVR